MVDKQQFFLPCFVVCAIFSAVITAQVQVDTDPKEIVVTENQRNVSLLCRVGRPIQFCTFTLPEKNNQVVLNPDQPGRDGMTYFGAGYQAGACGVTIDRITTAHNGQFKCSLFDTDRSNEGFINVVVAVAPEQPQIQLEQPTSASAFEVNSEMVVHCISRYGSPAASLYWFLDDEPIYNGISQPEYHEENNQGYSVYVTLRRHILASDSGKRLICRAKHVAYRDEMAETSLQIIVNYAPQALPETTVHGLTLGRTVDVTVQIHANPAPRVMWVVDGMTIEQGQEHDRYAARVPERLDNGAFNVTLTIAGLTLEDLSKRYQLQASNQVGVQDYVILLSSLDAEVDESGGVGVGGIIGIVLAALIVLVAIALIIMARATGRWCFRGKASSTTTSNARIGESDTVDEPGAGQQLLPSTTAATTATPTTAATPFTTIDELESEPSPNRAPSEDRVYNATTVPILRPKNLRNPDVIPTQQQQQRPSIDSSSVYSGGSSVYGDPNQVGLPVVKGNRWIPSQQRELLEKQANLLMSGANARRKRETEIF
ncbi:fasciclin-3 isoform X2 [Aedes albopictus]|uniref:Ig-like domain-containing protein n=1 Tax=Aedes albopictus TaxID=7160 RepID=A0ABM1ZGB0_AEDAL|nr:fasciclin-3-like isoform X2 [Aedes albopictus]